MPFSVALPSTFVTVTYDSLIRMLRYVKTAERQAQFLLGQLANHPDHHLALRAHAQTQRNQTLDLFRRRITPFGRAFSEALKEEGKTLAELILYYQTNTNTGLGKPEIMAEVLAKVKQRRFRDMGRAVIAAQSDMRRADIAAQRTGRAAYDIESGAPDAAFWTAARKNYLFERLRTYSRCSSEIVSRQIIGGSGRTNKTINIIAKISATTGIGVIIAGGVISVLWFGFDAVPRELSDWLTFPTVESAVRATALTVGGLGGGLLARGVGHCMHALPTGVRVTGVITTQILFLALLAFLWTWLIGPLF
ncbi:hypothetical protein [Polaromonas sp.]|uniref:hypothetical protein n=1 Tax=Polaromonas sp. TaxID=1869339 RepID=UPI0032649A8A